jgi:hypothetical protein
MVRIFVYEDSTLDLKHAFVKLIFTWKGSIGRRTRWHADLTSSQSGLETKEIDGIVSVRTNGAEKLVLTDS